MKGRKQSRNKKSAFTRGGSGVKVRLREGAFHIKKYKIEMLNES